MIMQYIYCYTDTGMQQTRNIITECADLGLHSNWSRGGRFCVSLTRFSISPEVERGGLLLNKTFGGSGKNKEDTSRAFYAAVWPRFMRRC